MKYRRKEKVFLIITYLIRTVLVVVVLVLLLLLLYPAREYGRRLEELRVFPALAPEVRMLTSPAFFLLYYFIFSSFFLSF